jgi:putative hydroxymethylpyrimidine transport system substrate-binding protein
VVAGDGGDPERVRTTTIGFEAVRAMVAGRVDGATAFWNVEGVALRARRPDTREFRVDDFGAPPYPELVLCVTRSALAEKRAVIAATIRALRRGYTETQADPESAVSALVDAGTGLDRETAAAQLDAVAPAFTAGARGYGELREEVLRDWAAWDLEFGILDERLDIERAFDFEIAVP